MSSGSVAGVVIGVLCVVVVAAVAVFMVRRWKGGKGFGVMLTSNGGFDNALYSQSDGQVGFSNGNSGGKVSDSNGTIHCNGNTDAESTDA